MPKVYIHDSEISPFGKFSGNHLELSYNTTKEIVQSFGKEKIEFLIYASFSPDQYTKEFHLGAKLSQALGLKDPFTFRSDTASSSGASAFQLGVSLIESGKFKHGLVVATEIMSQLNREENNLLLGSVLSDHQRKLGMSMAQGGALITNRYLYDYEYKREDLFYISQKLHDNGLENPKAHIKKKLTELDYKNQTMIASPLGLFDISPLSDGSVGLILSRDKSDISVRGLGHGTAPFITSGECSFSASVTAFKRAYESAELGPNEIGFSELHDAFTPFECIGAEDAGIFNKGEALRAVIHGLTHPKGPKPINVSGGLKSRGHPVGASGLAQIAELVRIKKMGMEKRFGLAHSIGGLATNNFATILEFHT